MLSYVSQFEHLECEEAETVSRSLPIWCSWGDNPGVVQNLLDDSQTMNCCCIRWLKHKRWLAVLLLAILFLLPQLHIWKHSLRVTAESCAADCEGGIQASFWWVMPSSLVTVLKPHHLPTICVGNPVWHHLLKVTGNGCRSDKSQKWKTDFILFTLTPEVLHGYRHCSFLDWWNYKIFRLQMAVDVLCQLEKKLPMFKIIYIWMFCVGQFIIQKWSGGTIRSHVCPVLCCILLLCVLIVTRQAFLSAVPPVCGAATLCQWCNSCGMFSASLPPMPEIVPASLWTRKDLKDFKNSLRKSKENVITVSSLATATVSCPSYVFAGRSYTRLVPLALLWSISLFCLLLTSLLFWFLGKDYLLSARLW